MLKIHLKGDEPCQNCGKPISSIKANRKITNFCRTCQTSRNKNFI
ncbi:MAG: zinc finger domain-containing protein [Candidatus Hodarchaeales archaeon]